MKIGPRYKIAKRLGAQVFDKTQTQKFQLSLARTEMKRGKRRGGAKSDYAKQFLEKQKVRMTYGITERQFRNYIRAAVSHGGENQAAALFALLERRLDNVVYRLGLTSSRRGARQMVSHGHIVIGGRKVTIPSYQMSQGDIFAIRPGSKSSALFTDLVGRLKDMKNPSWLSFDPEKGEGKVNGAPRMDAAVQPFDLPQVLEFYTR